MATNGDTPVADAEMAECDEVVTMMDVLKEQQDFEDDANAVLGGSDEKECTYSQGYIKRQAIYACLSCCPESKEDPSKRAGFCLACSLNCHENHDLVELYTKRNFRCDCGNPKFKSPCQFTPSKPELNDENVYNQNFIGLYCICNKPYGDQETTLDDEMIQCIICEDWWHATHLDAVVPANDLYSEMICKLCMAKNEFLHDYGNLAVNVETGDVDVINVNNTDEGSNESNDKLANGSLTNEKTANVSGTVEKIPIGRESPVNNDMETSATETPNNDTSANNNECEPSSSELEAKPEKSDNETVESTKSAESCEENKSTEAPMDTDENDKAADVLTEIISEEKPDSTSEDKIASSIPSEDVVKETISDEKTKEVNEALNEEKIEKCDEALGDSAVSADKANVKERAESEESADTKSEDESEPPKEINENADLDTPNTENVSEVTANPSENVETNKSKVTEEQDTETDAKNVSEVTANPSENVETNKSKLTEEQEAETDAKNVSEVTANPSENVETNKSKLTEEQDTETDAKREEVDEESLKEMETDKPSIETNENTSDEAKAAETSQDEEMNDISKDTEIKLSEDESSKDTNIVNIDVNGSKQSDSTNKIGSESNENIVPELASTENKRKILTEDDIITIKKPKLNDSGCVRPKGVKRVCKGATFWPSTFRQKLCKCNECIVMYKDLSVLFLTDLEDTVFAYETLGKEKTAGKPNQYEKGLQALSTLGRIQQIDALTEYNKMKDKLLTFLQSFKDKKEIVTEHDIKSFFAGMKPEKRTDGVYFCR